MPWSGNPLSLQKLVYCLVLSFLFLSIPHFTFSQTPYGGTAQTIPGKIQAERYDVGGEGVAYHEIAVDPNNGLPELNNGGAFRTAATGEGVDVYVQGAGGNNAGDTAVAWVRQGEWIIYTVNVLTAGTYTLNAYISTDNNTRKIDIVIDGANVGTLSASTAANNTYASTNNINVALTTGTHTLKLDFPTTGNYEYMNIAHLIFCLPPTAYSVTGGGSYCSGGSGVSVGLGNSETGVNYQLKVGGVDIGSPVAGTGSAISFGNQTTGGTYTVLATRVTGGCTTTMTGSVNVTINALPVNPGNPTSNSPQCIASGVTLTSNGSPPIGETWYWQTSASGTSTASSSSTYIGYASTTYYIRSQNNTTGCWSAGAGSLAVTIATTPSMTSAASASICNGGTVNIILTSDVGTSYTWQAANNPNTTGESITLQSSSTLNNTITNASAVSENVVYTVTPSSALCVGTPQTLTVTVLPPVAPPTGATGASVCLSGSMTISVATPGAGFTIDWYAGPTGGSALASGSASYTTPVISSTTTYYAETRSTGSCGVSASRTAVVATVNTSYPSTPASGSTSPSPICGTILVTFSVPAPATGLTIDWYSAASGGTLLLSGNVNYSTTISSTTSFFAEMRSTGGCGTVSSFRREVQGVVLAAPTAPTGAIGASYCGAGSTTLILNVDDPDPTSSLGFVIDWYNAASGGTEVSGGAESPSFTTPSISSTTTYYAEMRSTAGCGVSSTRTAVVATILNPPAAPPGGGLTGKTSVCKGESGVAYSIASIAGATSYTWSYITGTNVTFSGSTTNSTTANYASNATSGSIRVRASNNGCLGTATNYSITVNSLPSTPVTPGNNSRCGTGTVALSVANPGAGLTIDWYANTSGGTALLSGNINYSPSVSSTTIFYAETRNTTSTCVSSARLAVTATVNPAPTVPSTPVDGIRCGTGTVGISVANPGTGLTIDWYAGPTGGAVLSGGTGTSSFTTPSISSTTIYYAEMRSTGSCGVSASRTAVTANIGSSIVWQGTTTDWFTSANWCGGIPTSASNVLIPSTGAPYFPTAYPDITTGIGKTNNITIQTGASVLVTGTGQLKISGNITNSGTLNATAGTVEFDSTQVQTISGSMFASKTIQNLINSNLHVGGLIISSSDTLKISESLTLSDNTKLTTGNKLVLLSNTSRTARIAPIGVIAGVAKATITGNVIIERYLPMQTPSSGRRWRLLGVPINSSGAPTISEAWQEGLQSTNRLAPVDTYHPYGTSITNGTGSLNGYDQGSTSNPSIYKMAPGTGVWTVPDSTNGFPITNYQAYMIFVRGDRSIIVSSQYINTTSEATLRIKGEVNTGDVNVTIPSGKQVLSNPYPSSISLNNTSYNSVNPGTTLNSTYYMWDPKLIGSKGTGAWVTFSSNANGTYIITPKILDSPYMSNFSNNGLVESGGAFMINAASSGNFIFHESDKLTTSSIVGLASRPMSPGINNKMAEFYTNLAYVDELGDPILADGVATVYADDYHNIVDGQDAPKFVTFTSKEKISLYRDSIDLTVERRTTITENDTIYLRLNKIDHNYDYQLQFISKNFTPGLQAFLIDKFLDSIYLINTEGVVRHNFSTNYNVNSLAVDRFKIVFRLLNNAPLPIQFSEVKAFCQNDGITVQWKVENEFGVKGYEVERSLDGINFIKTNTIFPLGNNNSSLTYTWLDHQANSGTYFYRIKNIEDNGVVKYSDIIKVTINKQIPSISIYPNPPKNNFIGIKMENMPKGEYRVNLFNSIGQLLIAKDLEHLQMEDNYKTINLEGTLSKGVYQLEVIAPNDSRTLLRVLYN
ncbi:MAG: PKD-like domain-containing protein [Bacteroidota bacterium]